MSCYPFDKKECEEYSDRRKQISIQEKGKKYLANNKNEKLVSVSRIDDCLIKDGNKCDFLLLNCDNKQAYFIELKGSNLLHAVDQISTSIDRIGGKLSEFKINGRIVPSRVYPPDIRSNKVKRLEKQLKKMGGKLAKKAMVFEENL